MNQKETFIIDLISMNVDPIYSLKSCHVTGCAIASTREEASIMIQDNLMSRSFVVIDILKSHSVSSLIVDNNKEQSLIRRAHSSPVNCSLTLIPFSGTGLSLDQINSYPSPANQMHS